MTEVSSTLVSQNKLLAVKKFRGCERRLTPKKLLPLVHKTCNTLRHVTFLLGQIPKLEKTTQALSVHRKGTFCIYIECLIVICLQVTTIKRGEKVSKCGVPV